MGSNNGGCYAQATGVISKTALQRLTEASRNAGANPATSSRLLHLGRTQTRANRINATNSKTIKSIDAPLDGAFLCPEIMAKRGRPRKYKSVKDFEDRIDAYVEDCRETEQPITWTGMALFLGFCGRAELDNYGEYEGFSQPVKRAKAIVEHAYEKRLHGNSPTGAIFALKNMGWSDKQDEGMTPEALAQALTQFIQTRPD